MRDEIAALRRARRVKRAAEEISTVAMLDSRNQQVGGFDPNLGASGRPEPLFELPAGRPASRRAVVWVNHDHHWGEKLEWTGTELTIEEAKLKGREFTIPLAPNRPEGVAEAALFASSWGWTPVSRSSDQQTPARIFAGSLHFLDARGCATLWVPDVQCSWHELIDVIKSAGLPFRAYVLSCPKKNAEEITRLLFPHARYCVTIRH